MKVEIEINAQYSEPVLLIRTRVLTPEINDLVEQINGVTPDFLLGYQEERIKVLQPESILRIYAEQQKVIAETDEGMFTL